MERKGGENEGYRKRIEEGGEGKRMKGGDKGGGRKRIEGGEGERMRKKRVRGILSSLETRNGFWSRLGGGGGGSNLAQWEGDSADIFRGKN
jgi:hypothetical protein